MDVIESQIERAKKRQKQFYSGKKKQYTLKKQLVIKQKSGLIVCVVNCLKLYSTQILNPQRFPKIDFILACKLVLTKDVEFSGMVSSFVIVRLSKSHLNFTFSP